MGVVEGVGAARPARRDARVAVETESLAWLLAVPFVLAGALVASARRGLALPRRAAAVVVAAAQAALLAAAVVCFVVQERLVYEVPIYQVGVVHRWRYFTPETLVVAALLTAGAYAVLARPALRERVAAWLRETDRRRLAAALI